MRIDISVNQTKDVLTLFKVSKLVHYVIAVCEHTNDAKSPVFLEVQKK